ncbi:hypothetical protein JWJ90_09010 [Desulfobulbus rhabdoformis]|uniref:hypothetical protein n=1 Tax=Desulfobulbus rhabdoformis TaxID=34032 RepID=UPI0019641D9A|nr:hypothetical protein [Desulfobulbus rhabdoformis]MBM9614430.1 hypothetical protein [Desulfobulbus rhabdoformis]
MTGALSRLLLVALVFLQVSVFLSEKVHAQEEKGEEASARIYNMSRGWVDSIDKNAVVIDDMVTPVSKVEFFDSKGYLKNISLLKQGEYVAFEWSDTLLRIYQLEMEGERPESSVKRDEQVPPVTDPGKTVIRQVDGVWKN